MNLYILIPVLIMAAAIVIWTIFRNNRDRKKYEDFLNRDFKKEDQGQDVNDKRF